MENRDKNAQNYAAELSKIDKEWGAKPNIGETNIIIQSYKKGWDECKKELLSEFKGWFCDAYCKFYKSKMCEGCPINGEEFWLND